MAGSGVDSGAAVAAQVRAANSAGGKSPCDGWSEFDAIDWGSEGYSEVDRELAGMRFAAGGGGTVEPWRRGYDPFDSQGRFHGSPAKFRGFSGPVGSGKSLALCREAVRLSYENPGCVGLIGAPTYPMLRDVTRAAFLAVVEEAGIPHDFKKAENVVTLGDCGSTVLFRSLDHYERIRGTNLAWFAVDELTYCRPEAWQRLQGRIRAPLAVRRGGVAAWTPKGFDWVYRSFIDPTTRLQGYEAIIARPGENTALPDDFYESLKGSYDERFYAQEALGEYLNIFAGRTYYGFDRGGNVGPVEFDKRHGLFWSLDFNVNPMCSVIGQRIGDRVMILDEIILPDSNTLEACEEFGERLAGYLAAANAGRGWRSGPVHVTIYGDAAGAQRGTSAGADRTDWAIVKRWLGQHADSIKYAWRVPASNPTVKGRVNAVNGLLKNADGERRLIIAPRCKELMADFEQVAWKTDPNGNTLGQIDKSDPKRTHASDALGYMVDVEFGIRGQASAGRKYLGT